MKERQERNAGQKAQVTQVDADICCVRTRTYSNDTHACPQAQRARIHSGIYVKKTEGSQKNITPCLLLLSKLFFSLFLQSEVFSGSEPVVFDLGAWRCHRQAQ